MKLQNLCIISQGGGARSIYTAGVIKGLVEKFSLTEVGDIVAPSGSAANFMYFTSGQISEIEKIWMDLIKEDKLVRPTNVFKNRPILDIDYLVDELVKKKFPFDTKAFCESSSTMHIPALRIKGAVNQYFTNKQKNIDYFEAMRATCAVPYFYGKKVFISGDYYIDGSIVDSFGLKKAMELGADNILVILTEPFDEYNEEPGTLLKKIFNFILFRKESVLITKKVWSMFKKYNREKRLLHKLRSCKNIYVLSPKKDLPVGNLKVNIEDAKKTLKIGYQDVIQDKGLENFILGILNKTKNPYA